MKEVKSFVVIRFSASESTAATVVSAAKTLAKRLAIDNGTAAADGSSQMRLGRVIMEDSTTEEMIELEGEEAIP